MNRIHQLLERLWEDYIQLNPEARAIHDLLITRGRRPRNDHIALRTYDHPKINVEALARSFVECGYQARDHYTFPAKKLTARHYEHADEDLPKVFISQLLLGELSEGARTMITGLIAQMPEDLPRRFDFCAAGRLWNLPHRDYEQLAAESEYAGWVAAFGFRANHFTFDVNSLEDFPSLEQLNQFLLDCGYQLNASGGLIKGSPRDLLEQSSTLANKVPVPFSDGIFTIPACYYEFAKRYHGPDGKLFSGFVAKSADKIFESTHRR